MPILILESLKLSIYLIKLILRAVKRLFQIVLLEANCSKNISDTEYYRERSELFYIEDIGRAD